MADSNQPASDGIPVRHSPKPVVSSWDVFDTLVARFIPNPLAVFDLVENQLGLEGFAQRRKEAQAALDRIGKPYVLNDIYRQMIATGTPAPEAASALRHEIATERSLLLPIRRLVEQVNPRDLIISDMYLPPEQISDILFDTCDLSLHRPLIRSNWGKHSGTLWPSVLRHYVVRRHVGDNPSADYEVPRRHGIHCELVRDAGFTAWEEKLQHLGLPGMALIQREVRLRQMPTEVSLFHEAVVGPYLTLLLCFALILPQRCGPQADFAFLSRDSDDLARVFAALFPEITARRVDLSRRLTRDGTMDAVLLDGIGPATVFVDMVASGRSFFHFSDRTNHPGQGLLAFCFLETMLNPADRTRAEERIASGRLAFQFRLSGGHHWPLEHLLQSPYPPVAEVSLDPASGGIVRAYGENDLEPSEQALIGWKSAVITELVRTTLRRGLPIPSATVLLGALQEALQTILNEKRISEQFSSFRAREAMDFA